MNTSKLGGQFTFSGTSLTVRRMGYGAMQLAGRDGNKLVWGPPRDIDGAIAVLREVVASGVNHIDTSDFYGPHITNQLIRRALHPYPEDLVIVTKVSARRGADGSWIPAMSPEELTQAVHDNLRNLGLDALDVVNLRSMFDVHGPAEGSLEGPLSHAGRAPTEGPHPSHRSEQRYPETNRRRAEEWSKLFACRMRTTLLIEPTIR